MLQNRINQVLAMMWIDSDYYVLTMAMQRDIYVCCSKGWYSYCSGQKYYEYIVYYISPTLIIIVIGIVTMRICHIILDYTCTIYCIVIARMSSYISIFFFIKWNVLRLIGKRSNSNWLTVYNNNYYNIRIGV